MANDEAPIPMENHWKIDRKFSWGRLFFDGSECLSVRAGTRCACAMNEPPFVCLAFESEANSCDCRLPCHMLTVRSIFVPMVLSRSQSTNYILWFWPLQRYGSCPSHIHHLLLYSVFWRFVVPWCVCTTRHAEMGLTSPPSSSSTSPFHWQPLRAIRIHRSLWISKICITCQPPIQTRATQAHKRKEKY